MNRSFSCRPDHIFRMTDDTGMFQHAVDAVPDPSEGYTTDDNARALIMASLLYEQHREPVYEQLLYRYASFLCYAQNPDGTFRNFMGYDRVFLEKTGSEDCFGRCLWAICYLLSRESSPLAVRNLMRIQLEHAILHCHTLHYLRAKAYAAVALGLLGTDHPYANDLSQLGRALSDAYQAHRDAGWHWFEDKMTYCNFTLPRAMLLASRACLMPEWEKQGLESLRFLTEKTTENGHFHAIGCHGWLKKGGKPAPDDEQPVEPCGGVLAYLTAYEQTKDPDWMAKAQTCFSWYQGANALQICMIDPETGGCYDGTHGQEINRNQGAESLVCYWIARLTLAQYPDTTD